MAGKRESRRIFDTVQILPRPLKVRQNASSVCQTRSCTEPRSTRQVHLNFHKVYMSHKMWMFTFWYIHSCTREWGFSVTIKAACKLLENCSYLIAI